MRIGLLNCRILFDSRRTGKREKLVKKWRNFIALN